ncbi:hypothetical protein DXG01_005885 [Tephrocybe rancida]|nr:hypothetical protein DXG01_005885 [Tephrocybe rancida]
MSSSSGHSQTFQLASPENDAALEDVSQGGSVGDHDPGPLGLGHLPLKRHHSQELESLRPPKLPRIVPDISLLDKAPSPTMPIEPVDSADQFLGDFIASVLTYAVEQEHDHGTPQAADRAAKLFNSFVDLFLDPIRWQDLLDYRGEYVQDLIDTMQSLLDDGFIEQNLRSAFIRALGTIAIQSQLYPSRFRLQNVTDQGVKVTLPYSRTTEGYMEGKAVCIKRTSAFHHLNPNLEEQLRETMVWAQLSHENVLPFYGICEIGDDPPNLVCDIAAGMSYLHGNGLIHSGIYLPRRNILVTSTVPPRACLAYPNLDNFQNMVDNMFGLFETSGFDADVQQFSHVALEILGHELTPSERYDDIFFEDQCPFGYLHEGLDESMWRLLADCEGAEELDNRCPTAHEIVERLHDGKEQWEIALAAQEHETDSIVKSAMTYVSLKQNPDKITQARAATQASALYDSFQNMFRDLKSYGCLIECRGEGAQALIESIQSVCDVAAGMSYLHDNGLNLEGFNCRDIGVTSTIPPRACIIRFEHACLEPARLLPDWSDDAKQKFEEAYLWRIYDRNHTRIEGSFAFSIIAVMILTGRKHLASYETLRDGQRLHMPVGYLDRGLDESMWQLLLDCTTRDLDACPTPRQIVEWLSYPEVRENQTRLRIAKKRDKVARLLSAICASVQRYKSLLSCNDNDAQTLLDTFQLLLDTNVVEDRTQLVTAIKRLSGPAKHFPRRFFLGPVPDITADPVASGGFADVYKVNFQGEVTCFKAYAKEAIVWAQLSHPNVLPFYGLAHSPTRLSFVTRWATQGDLTQYLWHNPGANGILLCKDTAAGAEYLHMNNVVHGDLKGCNVLIDSSGRASLCDFGLASVTDPKIIKWTSQSTMASKGGTARWQTPEIHEPEDEAEEVYNTKATDVFAWAGICYEVTLPRCAPEINFLMFCFQIFTGCLPFFELSNPVAIMARIIQGHTPTRPATNNVAWGIRGLNEHVWNLMKECWHFEPSTRPDMTQILLKLTAENVIDTRGPGEWEKGASMRFRNSQDSKESDSVNSMQFWEDLESLLLRVAPGVEDVSA